MLRHKPQVQIPSLLLAALIALHSSAQTSSAEPHGSTRAARPPSSSPRAWPIVVGSLIFAPAYGATAYWALSGDATSYGRVPPGGSKGENDFGKPGWLFVPVLGPLIFDLTFCSDARDHYDAHPETDEPRAACLGSFWTLDAAVQAVGAAFIVAGFVAPVEHRPSATGRFVVAPLAGPGLLGASGGVEF